MNAMFCYQCEQRACDTGCTVCGVCGKDAVTASLQDLILVLIQGVAQYAHRARALGKTDDSVNRTTLEALFSTVTNVNFDPDTLMSMCQKLIAVRERARQLYEVACVENHLPLNLPEGAAMIQLAETLEGRVEQAKLYGVEARKARFGEDVAGLHEMIYSGCKGLSAYADHAVRLGLENEEIYAYLHKVLSLLTEGCREPSSLVTLALECGKCNLTAMELLDTTNRRAYGNPEPTSVRITPKKGKAILVSGHDLLDLHQLLEQTEGTGIQVYTHGEMLPCNAYPGLKKYSHLAGNYGGAWQDQQKEFEAFPGAILMTTNCIQRPKSSYLDRIFTCGLVRFPGVKHLDGKDFSPLIAAALTEPGFESDAEEKRITIGFGHDALTAASSAVTEAVKAGKIRHFFLIGGCDGAKPGRNYFTEFAEKVPQDCVILTLACGKYRFNKLDFGDIGGIPRLLDLGQCNDAYSAVKIAQLLAEAFDCGVNDLPLSLIISWYEQKAVAVLLTLLHLGIRNIRLGPTLPAFVTPDVLKVLVASFALQPITTPDEDLKTILG